MTIFVLLAFQEKTKFFHVQREQKFELSSINPFSSIKLILGMDVFVSTLVVVYAINFVAISDSMTSGFLYLIFNY